MSGGSLHLVPLSLAVGYRYADCRIGTAAQGVAARPSRRQEPPARQTPQDDRVPRPDQPPLTRTSHKETSMRHADRPSGPGKPLKERRDAVTAQEETDE